MSFGLVKAGETDTVRGSVADDPHIAKTGGTLGELTQRFIGDVLALQGSPSVIVEASGHSDPAMTNLSISIRPVL